MARVRPRVQPLARSACALAVAFALGTATAHAQGSDTARAGSNIDSTAAAMHGDEMSRLPVDRLRDALLLLPGVTAGADSSTLFLGSLPGGTATYIDGIPVSRAFHGLSGVRGSRAPLEPAANAVGRAGVQASGTSPRFGNASGAVVLLETPRLDARSGRLRFDTDALPGGNSLGYTRLQGSGGGPLGRRLAFFAAATLEGQKSVALGHDASDAPIFVTAGLDTTVANSTTGIPDTVYNFAVARGDCDAFAGSTNAGIANNYGVDCSGRTPASARSHNQVLARIDYALGRGRVSLLGLAGAGQARTFDYLSLYAPVQHTGTRERGRVLALTLAQPIGAAAVFEAGVSQQQDRIQSGPVLGDAFDTGPLGLDLVALDFRYDFDDWRADDELIDNYRTGSGVRAPCIEPAGSPSDCVPVNRLRNNAYGVAAFTETGGPSAILRHYREDRTVLQASVLLARGASHRIRIGGEYARTTAENYTHATNGTAASDVWREQPARFALYAEDRFALGGAELLAGVRFESFDSRARRPYFFCDAEQDPVDGIADGTCGGVLDVGERQYFPRIISSPHVLGGGAIDDILVADEAHNAFSPRIAFRYASSPRTTFTAGYSHLAQLPEYGVLFARVNTDLAITSFATVFGTDLGLQRSRIVTGGVQHRLDDPTRASVTVFNRWLDAVPVAGLVRVYDPFRRNETDLRVWQMRELGTVAGVAAQVERDFGRGIAAGVAYTWQDGDAAGLRPHTLAATLAALDGAVLGVFRWASGAGYAVCDDGEMTLSDEPCTGLPLDTGRLPALRSLDLRVSHTFDAGGRSLTLFADGRNLLNARNLLRVFSATGSTENGLEQALAFAGDSAEYASQAQANGLYDGGSAAVDLTFGGAGAAGCGGFVEAGGASAAADCVYLVRAEERYGDGDGVFTLAEQRAASNAFYMALRGQQEFTGDPRRVRFGVQVGF